ncbi:MAG: hypothetical protein IPF75_01510 [Bacteroidetes bacterium]|nr:hypothetical protein [Bacteroidota bacterium]
MKDKFHWQGGYGAFSYTKSDLMNVIKYIQNQKEHHKKISFTEYRKFLQLFEVDFDERFIFIQTIQFLMLHYLEGKHSMLSFPKKSCVFKECAPNRAWRSCQVSELLREGP